MSDTNQKTVIFDVVIVGKHSGEICGIVAATVEAKAGLQESCEARIVPTGKFKVGDKLPRAK